MVKVPVKGQVVVEMLLILPVFFTIVFTIMEMGNIAFQMIMLNHATYEVARVAAMTRMSADVNGSINGGCGDLIPLMKRIIGPATVDCTTQDTTPADTQAGITNKDVIVVGTYDVPLVFPISSILLSSSKVCPQGPGGGRCKMHASIRMPIERPLKR